MPRVKIKLTADCAGPSLFGKRGQVVEVDSRIGWQGLAELYVEPKPKSKAAAKRKGRAKAK